MVKYKINFPQMEKYKFVTQDKPKAQFNATVVNSKWTHQDE